MLLCGLLCWGPAVRIVSLIASATEIICALDAGEWLVGRSHECDAPAWVRSLTAFSQPAFDITVSSAEIDRSKASARAERTSLPCGYGGPMRLATRSGDRAIALRSLRRYTWRCETQWRPSARDASAAALRRDAG